MERWCEIYADEAGQLVIENHDGATVESKALTPTPFWRLTLPFRRYCSCKVKVV